MEERLAEEEDEDEDEDQVKSFKSAKKGPASKKRKMQQDSEEESEEESELDEDIDDEPKKKPLPPKKMQKINNAPVHPYQNEDEEDDGAVNPFQPVAPTPIKLPPVNKLGGQAGKPVNYDFSNPFGGPQGQLPPIGRPGGAYP